MELLELGPIPLGIALIFWGTQLEKTNGEDKGKTWLSFLLYTIGSILILLNIIYLLKK
jgi:hypothetical protein